MLTNSATVVTSNETAGGGTPCASQIDTHLISTSTARLSTPSTPEAHTSDMPHVGRLLDHRGISESATSLILQFWRKGTKQQYKPFLTKWEQYCSQRKINPFSAPIAHGINFLEELHQTRIGYSALNTARQCALSTVRFTSEHYTSGQHPGKFRMQTLSTKVPRNVGCDSGIRLSSYTWLT